MSFDDNFQGWYDAILFFERLRLKVTFYVNALPLDDHAATSEILEYYRRIHQPPETKPLSRAGLHELAAQGHTIGSHTYSHRMLTALPLAEAIEEIRRGRAELEELLGMSAKHFSYPFGQRRHFSRALSDYCRRSGFETVANAIPGRLHCPQQPFSINRTGWDLNLPLSHNLQNIRIDGSWFERLTGRSAVGPVFPTTEVGRHGAF
jgi:peptidoglycan/xylan/chitin deacetylase (PgdA/CDA1 family)